MREEPGATPRSGLPRLGLVLSGGGSRGIAQIGVLRALNEHGISADCVAGASVGAIIGALYAAGHSTSEMLRFFETRNPFHLSKFAFKKPGFIDTAKIVADFAEYFPQNSFEALGKPLRIVATDILNSEPVIFDSGPLIPAILASSAVPLVFTPVQIDGRWFSDGGIASNFPVELLQGRCRMLLGVFATPRREILWAGLTSSVAVVQRSLEVGMYLASRVKFERCDVVISPTELQGFGLFDARNHLQIERIGYEAALRSMAEIERALVRADEA